MGTDVAPVRPTALSGDAPRAAPLEALTRRASLNAVAGLLDYAAKAVVVLLVTPVLVSGLGRALYGVWEMLTRLGLSMNAVDGRPSDALRLVVAQHQTTQDDDAKRRFVGAALLVYALVLPALAIVAGIIAWFVAPRLAQVAPELHGTVRLSAALVLGAFVLTGLAAAPEAVLRGMNLGYRRMGVQAGLNVLNGALAVGAVSIGLGIAGVAGAQLVFAVASGVCFWVLARRFVRWMGVARPRREDVRLMFGVGAWLTAGDAIAKLMLASDALILGAVIAPAVVTTYVLTGYAARLAMGMHVFAASAAMPGLGGLLGRGELTRAANARRELLLLTWTFATAVGATILVANRAFIALWVGEANYAGPLVDLLIVLLTIQTIFIRADAYIIDAALQPRWRVMIAGLAMVLSIGLAIVLTRTHGMAGLCLGLLLGRAVQSLSYPWLARRHVGSASAPAGHLWRRMMVMVALLVAAAWLGQRLVVDGWIACAVVAAATASMAGALALILGPDRAERRALWVRLDALRRAGRRG